jgi:hypothetical protein
MSASTLATPRVVQRETETNAGQSIVTKRSLQPSPLSAKDKVTDLAHSLWKQRGSPDGSPENDWFEAEKQSRNRAYRFEAWRLRKQEQDLAKLPSRRQQLEYVA